MANRSTSFAAILAAFPVCVLAHGLLEIPGSGTVQTGIGVMSGWHCTANRIYFVINGGPRTLAGSRLERVDTLQECGRTDTGFSLLLNYNRLLPDGHPWRIHYVSAFADDSTFPFDTTFFRVTHFGPEMLTGVQAAYSLPNFPQMGDRTRVEWDEAKQNFSITSTCCRPPLITGDGVTLAGIYYGAYRGGAQNFACGPFPPDYDLRRPTKHGTFVIGLADGQMSFAADFVDGTSCRASGGSIHPFYAEYGYESGYAVWQFSAAAVAACPDFAEGFEVRTNGDRLEANGSDGCRTGRVLAAK